MHMNSLWRQRELCYPDIALCPPHRHAALHLPLSQRLAAAHDAQLLPKLGVVAHVEAQGQPFSACSAASSSTRAAVGPAADAGTAVTLAAASWGPQSNIATRGSL